MAGLMNRDYNRHLHLLERRLGAMQRLRSELQDTQAALVDMDMPRLEKQIAIEAGLCSEVTLLDSELLATRPNEDERAPEAAERLSELRRQLAEVQSEVRRLNRVHAALLRRSRRSVNILMNVLASYSHTCQRPGAAALLQLPGGGS